MESIKLVGFTKGGAMGQVSFENFDSLGACSYYILDHNSNSCHSNIFNFNPSGSIDVAAVLGVIMKNYPISNRTLIQGISRTPWMAKPAGLDGWLQAELPLHGSIQMTPEKIAVEMKQRLQTEAIHFLEGKAKIGILLSGGMDSRIVAGIVRQLQEDGTFAGDVVALTWGLEDSRDVIYARRIADQFGWEFRHFPLTAQVLKENIHIAADRGAEYSPVHLHAMHAVSQSQGLNGILAGSYGDSIGRGEYSGRRVNELPHILDKDLNQFAFLLKSVERDALSRIKVDLAADREKFAGRSEMAYREIEMQMHYMRRQLNACMETIGDKIPLYQMFGAPEIFGFMWSLDPTCRTDDNYEFLLKILPGNLLDIPWARTGVKYNKKGAKADDFLSANNRYGLWLRDDLRDFILDRVRCGTLQSLNIFDNKMLELWCLNWSTSNSEKADRLDEKMAWLASLSIAVEKYQIRGPSSTLCSNSLFTRIKSLFLYKAYRLALRFKQ